ncbi:MAG: nuclear transport factor 2 family protein [Deinococcales bacterium]
MAPTGPAGTERDARVGDAPERVVRAFLSALETRDLTAAGALLNPDVRMVFPGGVEHRNLDELVRDASERYRRVGKRIASVEVHDGGRLVYVLGTLHGVDLTGTPFEGVRFIDRFEIAEGKIHRQDVWNDLAESGVVKQRP